MSTALPQSPNSTATKLDTWSRRSPSSRGRQQQGTLWIFTKHGFFSAVCARQGDGKNGQPVDPDRIMIRARIRGHLEALKERFPGLLVECDVQESAGTDYAYRLFVQK